MTEDREPTPAQLDQLVSLACDGGADPDFRIMACKTLLDMAGFTPGSGRLTFPPEQTLEMQRLVLRLHLAEVKAEIARREREGRG
jgi:hypothetical protein